MEKELDFLVKNSGKKFSRMASWVTFRVNNPREGRGAGNGGRRDINKCLF